MLGFLSSFAQAMGVVLNAIVSFFSGLVQVFILVGQSFTFLLLFLGIFLLYCLFLRLLV